MVALDHGPKDVVAVEGVLGWTPGDLELNLYSAQTPCVIFHFSEIRDKWR